MAKEHYWKTSLIDTIRAYHTTDKTAANVGPMFYYMDPKRGAVPEWRNAFAVMAWGSVLDFNPVDKAPHGTAPTLVIHSDGSAFPDQAPQVREFADRVAAHFHATLG